MNKTKTTLPSIPNYDTATGEIRFNLTNDFMFHVVFEENNHCNIIIFLL